MEKDMLSEQEWDILRGIQEGRNFEKIGKGELQAVLQHLVTQGLIQGNTKLVVFTDGTMGAGVSLTEKGTLFLNNRK